MAGRPQRRAIIAELEHLTREYFGIADGEACEHSHLDYVVAWQEGGKTLRSLAENLSITLGFDVRRERLSEYLSSAFPGESEARLSRARAAGAHAIAEEAIEIVDARADDSVDVQRAALRAKQRNYMAERWNRAEFGTQATAAVTISIGSLHLEALRAPKADQALPSHLVSDAQDVVIAALAPVVTVPSEGQVRDDAANDA